MDHQGLIYEKIDPSNSSARIYPLVLMAKYEETAYPLARKRCANQENILFASKKLDLERIRQSLSGEISIKGDQLDLYVNKQEMQLVSEVKEAFARLNLPLVKKSFWPGKARACCVITHDIDWFTYSPFHKVVFGGILKPQQLIKLIARNIARGKNYGWNIPEMIELEKSFGCKSTFLFQTEYPEKERAYFAKSLEILRRQQDFEVALHASHSSHKDPNALERELSSFRGRVGKDALGIRYHILKFENPRTWDIEVEKNMKYDATFSYNEFYGFRSEICLPYHPFTDSRRLPILELPTGFMDWTMLHRKKRGSSADSIMNNVRENVETHNGVLVVNFHNTYINQETFPDIVSVYTSLMKKVSSGGYWIATALECANWWNDRINASPNPRLNLDGVVEATKTLVELEVVSESKAPVEYLNR